MIESELDLSYGFLDNAFVSLASHNIFIYLTNNFLFLLSSDNLSTLHNIPKTV